MTARAQGPGLQGHGGADGQQARLPPPAPPHKGVPQLLTAASHMKGVWWMGWLVDVGARRGKSRQTPESETARTTHLAISAISAVCTMKPYGSGSSSSVSRGPEGRARARLQLPARGVCVAVEAWERVCLGEP